MNAASKVIVTRTNSSGHRSAVSIEAPKDKGISFDGGLLQHGILSLGEFGPSGIKIAAFRDWDEAWFDADEHGYKIGATWPPDAPEPAGRFTK